MKSFETVKGLECCQTYHECSKCPYNTGSADTDECKSECMRDAAELINEKQTEIERLQHILISFMNEVEVLERKYGADISNIPAIAVLGTERENIIKQTKIEAIREFSQQVQEMFARYTHLHNYADSARTAEIESVDGTKIELFSVWDVLTLKKHEMAEYEEMNELQKNIEYIANDRLLSELEKDFGLLIKETVGGDNA